MNLLGETNRRQVCLAVIVLFQLLGIPTDGYASNSGRDCSPERLSLNHIFIRLGLTDSECSEQPRDDGSSSQIDANYWNNSLDDQSFRLLVEEVSPPREKAEIEYSTLSTS